MTSCASGVWRSFLTAGALAGLLLPAIGGAEVYSWRTEDGGYAFTDDEDAIPPRYRDSAQLRPSGSLQNYERFTPEDDVATDRYAERLGARLRYLRAVNDRAVAAASSPVAAAPSAAPEEFVTLRSGGRAGGGVDVSVPASGDEPIVIERVYIRRGSIVQPAQVTRRGGRIISVDLPRDREWNVNDALDTDDLAAEGVHIND